MGKKKLAVMAEQRIIFCKGAKENGVEEQTASEIFDLMEKFVEYGFNKISLGSLCATHVSNCVSESAP